jgi:hypothetical protein
MTEELFSLESLTEKADIIKNQVIETKEDEVEVSDIELFKVRPFHKF